MKSKYVYLTFGILFLLSVLALVATLICSNVFNFSLAAYILSITISLVWMTSNLVAFVITEYKLLKLKCKKCGEVFKPSFKTYFLGLRTFKKIKCKCHHCKEKNWAQIEFDK